MRAKCQPTKHVRTRALTDFNTEERPRLGAEGTTVLERFRPNPLRILLRVKEKNEVRGTAHVPPAPRADLAFTFGFSFGLMFSLFTARPPASAQAPQPIVPSAIS